MTAPLADVLRHLRLLIGWSSTAGQTDGQLLERFVSRQEEAAFEELLARHGPMVLGVCRQLLPEPHDAEDAFQATFLVLVRRAASIGKRDQLAGWLYGVAHRVAGRARAQKARRSERERQGADSVAVETSSALAWDDRQPVIHEEINRLPEKYRVPVVLCYLEGKTQEEAARDLGWTRGAVKGRLERARDLLRKRLLRRGVALSAGALAAFVSPTASAVSPALAAATLEGATLLATGKSLAAGAVSPQVISLTEGVLRTMFFAKLKIAAAVLLSLGIVGAGLAVSVYRSPAAEQAGDDLAANSKDTPPNKDQPAKDPAATPAEAPLRKVQVTQPLSRKVVDHQEYTGRTEATTVQVVPGASGALMKVTFPAGETVKKGDLLFEIDPRPYRAEVDKAQAEFKRAQVHVEPARKDLENQKRLSAARATSQTDLDRATADYEEAMAALQAARATVELAQLHLESTAVRAPIDGRIGQPLVTTGNYVKAGTTVLATIVVTDPIYVQFELDERTFLQLRRQSSKSKVKLLGASIRVQLADEKDFTRRGVIDFIGNQVDPQTETVRVRAALSNADHFLLPGLFVRIRLAVSAPYKAVLVPDRTAIRDGDEAWLWVATKQDTLERRRVQLGRSEHGWQVVKEGLAPDDWVIIGGLNGLFQSNAVRIGMKIQPEPVKPAPPPEPGDQQPQPAPPGQPK